MKKTLKIALIGNPNSGKTSLFNALTGLNQKVSNHTGTTIEKKTGQFKINDTHSAEVIDLPGTYSLYPKSADEQVTYDVLRNPQNTAFPDMLLFLADASNLKRNLLLLTQVADLGIPLVLALNMVDLAERKGIFYNIDVLTKSLNIPIVAINARNKTGIDVLKQTIVKSLQNNAISYFSVSAVSASLLNELKLFIPHQTNYGLLQYAIAHSQNNTNEAQKINALFAAHQFNSQKFQENEVLQRYYIIDNAIKESRNQLTDNAAKNITQKIDKWLMHPVFGVMAFLVVMILLFQAVFSWSEYPMQLIEACFGWLSNIVASTFSPGLLTNLLVNGVIPGLSGVLVFLPQILVLFAFIALLEDVGYMARVSFLMDNLMRPLGMNGKSVVPLISGMACAVPSIMASRSIENKRERLITIFVTPLMSCSARLPIYTLLIGMLLPKSASVGPFNAHGLLLLAMYLLGFFAAIISAWVINIFLTKTPNQVFIMELPSFKPPLLKNLLITLYIKGSAFVIGAGKIILAVSILLWALASFGPGDAMQNIEKKYATHDAGFKNNSTINAEKLEASYAGVFGKAIEPAIKPLGFDWKIGIALLTSFAAREVFVGTINTIYSVGSNDADVTSIGNKLKNEKLANGKPAYPANTILSLLVFYAFAMQCISTLSVVKTETKTWKWPLIQFGYMSALAYVAAWITYLSFS